MFRSTRNRLDPPSNSAGTAESRPTADASAEDGLASERAPDARQALTLTTPCACGHTRRDHRGLRIEVMGSCLECGCEEFRIAEESPDSHESWGSRDQTMRRIRTALERVERLQEMATRLRNRGARSSD